MLAYLLTFAKLTKKSSEVSAHERLRFSTHPANQLLPSFAQKQQRNENKKKVQEQSILKHAIRKRERAALLTSTRYAVYAKEKCAHNMMMSKMSIYPSSQLQYNRAEKCSFINKHNIYEAMKEKLFFIDLCVELIHNFVNEGEN